MTKHQPKTFMGIDLAQATVGLVDLGVSVEEAPEAPEPATDAPRTVTVESIEAKIAREDYLIGINGGTLTICVLTLANGFDVTGESACVDPANFDEALGKKYARADAFKKIWPLEGYLLREQMMQAQDVTEPATDTGRAADEGWDDPEAAADDQFHANALIGTQSEARPYTDRQWLRQRAYEMAQVGNAHLDTLDLIENARKIEDYFAGRTEPEAVTEAAPPTDAELIQRAKDVLVNAVTRGEAPACDQAGNAIQAMADWLNGAAVAD